jgi:hypothetical protein
LRIGEDLDGPNKADKHPGSAEMDAKDRRHGTIDSQSGGSFQTGVFNSRVVAVRNAPEPFGQSLLKIVA